MKYLVLLAVLAVVLGVWRSRQSRSEAPTPPAAAPRPPLSPQDMVACAHCGLHLPRSEALAEVGQMYCCREHQRLGPR